MLNWNDAKETDFDTDIFQRRRKAFLEVVVLTRLIIIQGNELKEEKMVMIIMVMVMTMAMLMMRLNPIQGSEVQGLSRLPTSGS